MSYYRTAVFFLLTLFALLLPLQSVQAAEARYYDVRNRTIDTAIDQSAFAKAGCIREFPYGTSWYLSRALVYTRINEIPGMKPYIGANQPTGIMTGEKSIWFCDPVKLQEVAYENGNLRPEYFATGDDQLNSLEKIAIPLINRLLWVSALVASWILYLCSLFLRPLLGVGSFITNPFVTSGWPFVQGIANLGFLLALLFIAFATTLRIESFSARRMLPRLLFAALFINFSLVICGLLIDVSRLIMAAILQLTIGSGSLDTLAFRLLQSSRMINTVFNTSTFNSGWIGFAGTDSSWRAVIHTVQGTLLLWALVIAFVTLIVGLTIRYIRLILLLIASPLAYLTMALPNMEGMARKWWADFIKYVLYGPIMVFILALLVIATDKLGENSNLLTRQSTTFNDVLQLLIVVSVIIAAATVSKSLGVQGATAALDFASNQTKRIHKGAYRGAKTATIWTAKKTSDQLEVPRRTRNFADRMAKRFNMPSLSPYYQEEKQKQRGKRIDREKSKSFGVGAAQYKYASKDKQNRMQKEDEWANTIKDANTPRDPQNVAYEPQRIRRANVAKEMKADQIRALAQGVRTGKTSDEQFEIMIHSPEMAMNMDIETPQIILTELNTRLAAATGDQKKEIKDLIKAFNKTIKEAERRASSG